jgi:outer membrane protein W
MAVSLPTRVQNYGVTALYYSHDETHHVRPFLSIGVGGTLYMLTTEAKAIARHPQRGNLPPLRNSNQLSMNYRAGVKTRVNHWLGFRADVKGFLSATPSFGLPHQSNNPEQPVLPVTGATNNGEASAGLVFYFFERR